VLSARARSEARTGHRRALVEKGIRAVEPRPASRSMATTVRFQSASSRLDIQSTISSWSSTPATRLSIARMRSSRNCDVRLLQRRPALSRCSREWPTLPAELPHVSGCADPGHRAHHRRWRRFRTAAFLCLSYTYAPQVLHAFGYSIRRPDLRRRPDRTDSEEQCKGAVGP
jgi:hypothetical protein